MISQVLQLLKIEVVEDDMDREDAVLKVRVEADDTSNGIIGDGKDGDRVAAVDLIGEVGG